MTNSHNRYTVSPASLNEVAVMLWLFSVMATVYIIHALATKNRLKFVAEGRAVPYWLVIPFLTLAAIEIVRRLKYPDFLFLQTTTFVLAITLCIIFFTFWIRSPFYGLKAVAPAGMAANLAAVSANGFRMPVNKELAASVGFIDGFTDLGPFHRWADETTRLVFLTDQIRSDLVYPGVASIGDVLLWLGLVMTAVQVYRFLRKNSS